MMIPVRCFSCGKVIGDKGEQYKRRVEVGEKPKDVLDDMSITRYCCRKMLITGVQLIDELIKYDMEKVVLRTYDREQLRNPRLYSSKKNVGSLRPRSPLDPYPRARTSSI